MGDVHELRPDVGHDDIEQVRQRLLIEYLRKTPGHVAAVAADRLEQLGRQLAEAREVAEELRPSARCYRFAAGYPPTFPCGADCECLFPWERDEGEEAGGG